MKIPEPNSDYELLPVGTYQAVCVEFLDFGTQSTTYGPKRQVRFGWEVIGQKMKNGKPFIASRIFTFSRHEKASFCAVVEGMTGKKLHASFDTKKLIWLSCLIAVTHNDNGETTFANVETVVPIPAGTAKPGPALSPPIFFSLSIRMNLRKQSSAGCPKRGRQKSVDRPSG